MKTRSILIAQFFLILSASLAAAPSMPMQDTTYLDEVTVQAYFADQPLLRLTASAGVIGRQVLDQQSGTSLLPALNTVPGVRMEERSPGSYRLSLRGSLLRSPFGVRNVKVYLDELPLTDAGGNTYFNLLDAGGIDRLEVLKGPDGSLFGANSGGVVIVRPNGMADEAHPGGQFQLHGGSFGLFQEQLSASLQLSPAYRFNVSQSFQRSDGYRQQSAMRRTTLQTVQRWQYRPTTELRLIALYTDLRYETPGGLTAAQYAENPRLARPATPTVPGAVDQQAGIYNRTLIGGLVHEARFSSRLRHVATVFGTRTDFRNPFITNYEFRDESNVGVRTYIDYTAGQPGAVTWRINAGLEWQQGDADIRNYDNEKGIRGADQASDILKSLQHFYFVRASTDIRDRLTVEASFSLNYYGYRFRSLFPESESDFTQRRFQPAWMPRVAISYLLTPQLATRVSVSRGYSPPTIAEIRSSDNQINTALTAETGWNREIGLRWRTRDHRAFLDASIYFYRMQDAIIRQLRESGAEYFSNAGAVRQVGTEAAGAVWVLDRRASGFLRALQLAASATVNHFRFDTYRIGEDDFTGNRLTGVPNTTVVSSVSAILPARLDAYFAHHYTSAVPLNDANTVYADAYHLLQVKLTWTHALGRVGVLQVFVGGDNLLNQRYSLGNDINAFGGRYYNAAAARNFYGGLAFRR